jgi:hypothetical protein
LLGAGAVGVIVWSEESQDLPRAYLEARIAQLARACAWQVAIDKPLAPDGERLVRPGEGTTPRELMALATASRALHAHGDGSAPRQGHTLAHGDRLAGLRRGV